MKVALTDVTVRALKAPEQGQLTSWDSRSPLGVRVSAAGTKTYIVMTGSGRRRTIGSTTILTLAEARAEAKRILAEKTLGIGAQQIDVKFETAATVFLEENYRGRKPRTASEAKRLITTHFMPAFRAKPLAQITDRDIAIQLAKLASRPSEQLHAFRVLRTMLRWCTRPPRLLISTES
ncbi:integrase arm-type DNA-binding domain-containing protein [Methylovirgula sp. HY1]|uniref:integrase arm-type DNA-binding domain-containing protein n=1 Tax=Methylovirgula sp. HY1 TaxID=2822761 RepID=UPI001C5B5457|nr:integrase arm-type DNA-binding domain-containing protein [Methylovirgula sp. HY1]QXX74782.1 hypothetical protein MHY1_01598 [Methylovirgula sp. HY1]